MEFTVTSPGKLGVVEKTLPTLSGEDWRLFNPSIDDDGSTYAVIRGLAKLPRDEAIARLSAFAQEKEGQTLHALKARVATTLIRDLLNMGWDVQATPHHLYVRPPRPMDPVERKALTRQQLLFGRDDQLREDSNRRFLYAVERPSKYSSCKPITDLIADGRRLAEQLRPIAAAPKPARSAMLDRVCQPYLQLVSGNRS